MSFFGSFPFLQRGDLKLFDLGMAKELPESHGTSMGDDGRLYYHLTACCGTPRYMASEVACGELYNELCDVYSFALLCWQMVALKSPFGKIDYKTLASKVWGTPCDRPKLDSKWPSWLKDDILSKGWSHNVHERPSMKDIEGILAEQVSKHKKEFDLALHLTTRRSTRVMKKLESMRLSSYYHEKADDSIVMRKESPFGNMEFHVTNPYDDQRLVERASGSDYFRAEF